MKMSWASYAAHLGEMINICNILVGTMKERNHLGDLDVDGRIILK
jgi:hypothetical protein